MSALRVLRAGPFTTLQDLGRWGFQSLGLPVSGALDPVALRLANALVGNDPGTAALEIRLAGPRLRVEAESLRVALTGSEAVIETDDPEIGVVAAGRSVTLRQGTCFGIGALRDSATACLAVAGGFDVAPVFGSRATYHPARLGGFAGRALQEGDRLPLCLPRAPAADDLALPAGALAAAEGPIRVTLGPQAEYFTKPGIETFLAETYSVGAMSDRMGMRLEGPRIAHAAGFNIPSDGVVTGAIQVPGHGQPIVLLADRQTTGGYPKIATVISTDLPRLARARPGSALRFAAVAPAEAEAIRRRAEARLAAALANLRPCGAAAFLRLLYSENLIDGVTAG
jgi:biotin-dependent carboxylase-like uncharacterized protein